jgi:hypothetical protein
MGGMAHRCRRGWAAVLITGAAAIIVSLSAPGSRGATPALVTRVTAAETANDVQVAVVASAPVQYQLVKTRPDWIVLQISPARLRFAPGTVPFTGDVVKRIRIAQLAHAVQLVVEMTRPAPFRVVPSGGVVAVMVQTATPRPRGSIDRLHEILPGGGIGRVRLGMPVHDAVAALGRATTTRTLADGNVVYEWFGPPSNRGIGARVTPSGLVYRVWALNDGQYGVTSRLHVGSTEADARATLGAPSQAVVNSSGTIKTLTYPALGLWVAIQMDPRYALYGRIFEIGVMRPETAAAKP